MTVRLLCKYGKYPVNAIVTLDAGTEAGLVAAKQASTNTTGGTPFVEIPAPVRSVAANLVYDYAGALLGIASADGSVQPLGGGAALTRPAAPVIGAATAGNGTATINWTPGANGGLPILYFHVALSNGRWLLAAAGATSITFYGLPNGAAVTGMVVAINALGPSMPSASSNAVTPAQVSGTAPAVVTAPVINGTPTAGAVVSSAGATFSGSPTPTVVTTWRIEDTEVGTGLPYSAPSDSATKSLVRRDTATNTAGSVYSDSAPVVIGAASVIVAEPQLFARPAAGLFYQGMIQSVKPGTSTPITAYDAEVAYRTTMAVDTVFVDVWNGVKINGDVAEQFLSMDTRWSMTLNSTNGAGATIAFPMVKNGTTNTSLTLAGGQFSFGTFMANTPGLLGNKNFVLMIRIDSPDGVSNISVPLGNPADYGATVLGGSDGYGRGQEGSVYNSATALTSKSPGGIEWAGRVPAHMVRPLAVYTKNAPKVRSCVVLSDSIGSPLDSYVARILNAAGIANINIGSGGESGDNYPTNAQGRLRVVPYTKSAVVELGRNGFGKGLENAKARALAIWANLRSQGVQHIIQTEITPNTTAAATNPSPRTVEGQNPEAGGIRIAFNDWMNSIKGTATGPDEVWPVEAIVSTPDRLKFKADMSDDYLHLRGAGTTEILNVAVANNWTANIV